MRNRIRQQFEQREELRRKLEAEHGAALFIASEHIPDQGIKGGCVTEVTPFIAARCIVKRSHRLATKAEIKAYREREQELLDENRRTVARMTEKNQVVLSQEALNAIGSAASRQFQPPAAQAVK